MKWSPATTKKQKHRSSPIGLPVRELWKILGSQVSYILAYDDSAVALNHLLVYTDIVLQHLHHVLVYIDSAAAFE